MALTALETKWMSILVVGLGSFFVGVAPACFLPRRRLPRKNLILSSLLCFGGGVLLATSVLHMLPETKELLPDHAELLFCCGYLLIYLIDEVVHWLNKEELTHRSSCDTWDVGTRQNRNQACTEIRYQTVGGRASPGQDGTRSLCYDPNCIRAASGSRGFASEVGNTARIATTTQYGALPRVPQISGCCGEKETLLCHGTHSEPCADSKTGRAALCLALTLHALLEGLAIGLQKDASEVLLLLIAVVSHKFVVAFCLGLELAGSGSAACKNVLAVGLFSGGSSLGIGVGMLLDEVETKWTSVLMPGLQGLAGGTLLYVTVSEVLPRERARWHGNALRSAGIVQFLSVLVGFALVYFLNKYLGEP